MEDWAQKDIKMDQVGAFAQLNCPCCFRPGNPLCESPSESLTAAQKLTAIRGLMDRHNFDAYLVVGIRRLHYYFIFMFFNILPICTFIYILCSHLKIPTAQSTCVIVI